MLRFWVRMCSCVTGGVAVLAICLPGAGAETCPNESVRIGPSALLPDCRAYEVVSPADKNGGDVIAVSSRTRAAAAGNAIQYASLVGFGDAIGGSLSFEYLAQRTGSLGTSGWSTHGITPGDPTTFATQLFNATVDSLYTGELSPDLSRGVRLSYTPLTSDSNTASDGFLKLYRRTDLLNPGQGTYQLVSDCPGCISPVDTLPNNRPALAGASADFSRVIFESTLDLTADAAGLDETLPKLYEWIAGSGNGTLSLVGYVPVSGTECGGGGPVCVVAPNSQAGGGVLDRAPSSALPQHYDLGGISTDGSRVFFSVRSAPNTDTGALYVRTGNGTSAAATVQLNAAEVTPSPTSQDAFFELATPDGSRAYFTTRENLTADDNNDLTDLYMYDVNAPAGHHLTLISEPNPGMSADVQGVVGVSDDGQYVYFISSQQLLSGQPAAPGVQRLYVWHDGTIHEVGAVASDDVASLALTESQRWRITPKTSRLTPDGTHLVFVSKNSGGGATDDLSHSGVGDACGEAGGCEEVYLYNALTGGPPTCVSCHTPDGPAQTDASVSGDYAGGAFGRTSHLNQPLSSDGRFTFFTTGDRLLPRDLDGSASDVYEYDEASGQVELLSSGAAGSLGSSFLDASTSGHDVFFTTHDQLNGWDTDSQVDLYDVRVNGGLPDPLAPPLPCVGDACHGATQAESSFGVPASSTISGVGNVRRATPPRAKRKVKCRRGLTRRRVHGQLRCVKVRHRAHNAGHVRKGGR